MGCEESTGEEVGRGRNDDVEIDVWSHKVGQNEELEDNKSERHIQESAGKEVTVVWTCHEKR